MRCVRVGVREGEHIVQEKTGDEHEVRSLMLLCPNAAYWRGGGIEKNECDVCVLLVLLPDLVQHSLRNREHVICVLSWNGMQRVACCCFVLFCA